MKKKKNRKNNKKNSNNFSKKMGRLQQDLKGNGLFTPSPPPAPPPPTHTLFIALEDIVILYDIALDTKMISGSEKTLDWHIEIQTFRQEHFPSDVTRGTVQVYRIEPIQTVS